MKDFSSVQAKVAKDEDVAISYDDKLFYMNVKRKTAYVLDLLEKKMRMLPEKSSALTDAILYGEEITTKEFMDTEHKILKDNKDYVIEPYSDSNLKS